MTEHMSLENRKDFLDRCTRCSQCKFVPVKQSQQHSSICPSIDFGGFHAYSASGQLIMGSGLLSAEVSYSPGFIDALSSCTMCGGCDISCKVNFAETVEPLDSLYALRAKVVQDGQSPPSHQRMIEGLRKEGNSKGKSRTERAVWQQHLPAPLPLSEKNSVLLHVGSSLSYDQSKHNALGEIVKVLQQSGVMLSHLGEQEDSCGATAFELGYTDDARHFAQKFERQVKESGAQTVVTFSSAAIFAYRSVYPRFGLSFGPVQVLHISEYLCDLADKGRIAFKQLDEFSGKAVAYHDPCKLGRLSEAWKPRELSLDNVMGGFYTSRDSDAIRFGNHGCYEAPRRLIRLMGMQISELERNRASSYCCGGGGGVMEARPEVAQMAAQNRLAEMQSSHTQMLISGCSHCAAHLGEHASGDIEVSDLLDFVAKAIRPATTE